MQRSRMPASGRKVFLTDERHDGRPLNKKKKRFDVFASFAKANTKLGHSIHVVVASLTNHPSSA